MENDYNSMRKSKTSDEDYTPRQEAEIWNGIHAQIVAPKGTFDKIWEEAEDNNDIDI